jgi:hypothetical protein
MNTSIIKIIEALLLCFTSALAATSTHTLTVFPAAITTNFSFTNAIPQWNPVDGILNSVTVTVAGNVSSRFRAESRDTTDGVITVTTDAHVTATTGGVTADAEITPTHTQAVTAYDGVLDYAGTSGFTVTSVSTGSDVQASAVLTPFIGTGTVPVTAGATATASYDGPGNYRFIVNTTASALVTVTYDFTPNCPECPSCDPDPDCERDRDDRDRDCDDRRKPRNKRR